MSVKPTSISFEQRYSDDSGVEFAVRLRQKSGEDIIEFQRVDIISFPILQLDWLIACLERIRKEQS